MLISPRVNSGLICCQPNRKSMSCDAVRVVLPTMSARLETDLSLPLTRRQVGIQDLLLDSLITIQNVFHPATLISQTTIPQLHFAVPKSSSPMAKSHIDLRPNKFTQNSTQLELSLVSLFSQNIPSRSVL